MKITHIPSLSAIKKINLSTVKLPRINKFNFLSPIKSFFRYFSHDIGVDLGTANVLVWVRGKGIIVREPSIIARQKKTKEILAIGTAAKKMLGKTPGLIEVVRPLKDGVIADFDGAEAILRHYIKKVHETEGSIPKIPRPRVIIGIPSGVTEVERRAVADVSYTAGAREVHLIEEPMAAAVGAGLPVEDPDGIFIVDIGGGTTEIALISLGGIVIGRSIRIAGDEMNDAIINFIRLKYSLLLGETTAEKVKIELGSGDGTKERFLVIRGRDLESGLPKSIKITSSEVREALGPIIQEIVGAISDVLEETPPELIDDVMGRGIIMAGGGSLLSGISDTVAEKCKIKVVVADDPLTCVVRGCGKLLEDFFLLERIKVARGL